eukprot:GGOE01043183.1.p1 GENE.GGOE01043183.1~~GGOE01043183.1.p1  ORF type:complete len:188 (+),score=44.76 GGOE01043183.1:66-629(+)
MQPPGTAADAVLAHPKSAEAYQKIRVRYVDAHKLVAKAAEGIREFQPDTILAIGTGGFVPAKMLRCYLPSLPILAVTVQRYDDIQLSIRPEPTVIQWLDPPCSAAFITGKRVLVVDDVNDSGTTVAFIAAKLRACQPAALASFVVHQKRREKQAIADVDVSFVGETVEDVWIEYPWTQTDIELHEHQ